MLFPLGLLAALALLIAGIHKGLLRRKARVDSAWADIDVQLKRRCDLALQLVDTMKGYAAHEKSTFDAVINARNRAMIAQGPAARGKAEDVLTSALRQLFALAEDYPQLRRVESFTQLQATLTQIEDTTRNARRHYNAAASDLNTKTAQLPWAPVAAIFGIDSRELFEMAAQAQAPQASSSTTASQLR